MLRDLLRIIGASCILSGIILYFSLSIGGGESELHAENNDFKNEVASLQTLLKQTEGELAKLQTLTSTAQQSNKKEEKNVGKSSTKNDSIKTVIKIEQGTSSKDVANELANASIIEDAEVLNTYLTSNNLAKKIQIGEYELDSSMSIETIAEIITR